MPTSARNPSVLRRIAYCLLPLALGAGAALLLLFVASGPARQAFAGNLTFPGVCGATIQACIDSASAGDTILISAGNYTESLTLSKAVSLTGALSSTTILHALPNTRVLTVTGAAVDSSVVISGLTFTGGHAVGSTCPDGCGGAILINGNAQPMFVRLMIANSLADNLGGGLYADSGSPLVMSGVTVLSNGGGGAYAWGSVTLTDSQFVSNTSAGYGGGLYTNSVLTATNTQFLSNTSTAGGGGALALGKVTLNAGLFENNKCTEAGCHGGGLYTENGLSLNRTQFLSNTSSGDGGGVDILAGATILTEGVFQSNQCELDACYGGAISSSGPLTLTDTTIVSNTAGQGGGGALAYGVATLWGGVFQGNVNRGFPGGGLYARSTLAMSGTLFLNNSAWNGGGVYVEYTATLTGGIFQGNSGRFGGGGLLALGTLDVTGTQFLSNTTAAGTGGGALAYGVTTVQEGQFKGNRGDQGWGGGLYAKNDLVVTDTLFVRNTAQQGGGLYNDNGNGRLVNDLFAGNTA